MSTPHEVKKTSTGRPVLQLQVSEHVPRINTPKLSPDARRLVLEALGLADTAGLVVGELAHAHEGIPAGSACARFYGSQGYQLRAVDLIAAEQQEAAQGANPDREHDFDDDSGSEPARDLDGSIDDQATRQATDPTVDPAELQAAHERVSEEIYENTLKDNDQLRRDVATLKAENERLKNEKNEVVKALNGHLARTPKLGASIEPPAADEPPFQAYPPPRKVATAAAVKVAAKKLNAKHGKGAGRSSKKK